MRRFVAASKAEWLKVFTTRTWWVLGLVMVLFIGFTAALLGVAFSELLGVPGEAVGDSPAPMIYSLGSAMGYLFPVLLGALSVTGEYRHHTLTPTFTSVGSRGPVLGAKVAVQAVLGFIYGIVAVATAVVASVFFFMAAGMNTGLSDASTWAMFARSVVAMSLWAVVGVGLGALIRSQAGAIVLVLAFTQFIEPIARMGGMFNKTAASITQFLPGSVSDAFVGDSIYSAMQAGVGATLQWWVAGLVLAGYGLVLTLAAYFTRWQGDVG